MDLTLKKIHSYSIFGRRLTSEIELPELALPSPADGPKIRISTGLVDDIGCANHEARVGPFAAATKDRFRFVFPDVVKILVIGGSEIILDIAPDADPNSVRLFLYGTGLSALMMQSGHLVLHGNAIKFGDGCIVCVGHSGAGKSTLAAAMFQHGHKIVADDVCPIDLSGNVVPGIPQMKLWKETADKLRIETDGLLRVRAELEKFFVPLGDHYNAQPLPVLAIYSLNQHNQAKIHIKPVEGIEKFSELCTHTYRPNFLMGMGLQETHFQKVMRSCGSIPVKRVTRPNRGFQINELIEAIKADFAEKCVPQ